MSKNVWFKGQLVRVKGSFTDTQAGALADPAVVKCRYKSPSGAVTVLTYATDIALVRDSTGVYHADINANEAGDWWYRFESTGGVGQAANEGTFFVEVGQF